MSLDTQALLRAADPAPNVPAYDDARTVALIQRAIASDPAASPTSAARTPRRSTRSRLAIGGAVAAVGAVAITVTANVVSSPVAYGGIELVREGDYYLVTITDPDRDPAALTATLTSKGLDINLVPVPVSPSLVGSIPVTTGSEGSSTITALSPPPCDVPSVPTGGCEVGMRIPVDFTGQAMVAVGRAARPGEDYSAAESSVSPGELFACQDLLGRPVADVVATVQAAGMTVEYRGGPADTQDPTAYADLFVSDVLPRNAATVFVFAEATATTYPLPEGC